MGTDDDDDQTFLSQESAAVVSQVYTERVDVGRMSGIGLAEFTRLHGNPDESPENSQNDNISIPAVVGAAAAETLVHGGADNATVAPPPQKKRKRMAFANKKLLAGRELFLMPQYLNQYSNNDAMLQGKVMKCATKKDPNSKFVIDWKKPFPAGVNPLWLRKEHDNTNEHREKLQDAILQFEAKNPTGTGTGTGKASATTKTPRTSKPITQPPSAIAAASVRTSSSTVSSLTRSTMSTGDRSGTRSVTFSAGTRRGTRSNTDYESDSNDEYDDLEENEEDPVEDPVECYDNNQEETEDDTDGNPESTVFQSLNQLEFKFREVQPGTAVTLEQPCKYNGPVVLKEGVAESFRNPFECLAQNGLDRSFVARLARNSNEYARKFILPKDRNRRLHGHDWRNITVSEMYVFLGITLRISLSPMDSGGYEAYFRKSIKVVMDVIIYGTKGFAHKYMKMWRYKQIRAALHPDDRKAASMAGTDKAFMLRHALNTLNTAASNVMHMSGELTRPTPKLTTLCSRHPS